MRGAWDVHRLAKLHHAWGSGEVFAPVRATPPDGWAEAIRSSQFPSQCGRMLLIEDDLAGQGLGITAELIAYALLIAMRHRRVLLEVAVDPKWGQTNYSCIPSHTVVLPRASRRPRFL